MAAVMLPGLEMVADEDRVETRLLREAAEREQFERSKLLRRRLVSKLQHDPRSAVMGLKAVTYPKPWTGRTARSLYRIATDDSGRLLGPKPPPPPRRNS